MMVHKSVNRRHAVAANEWAYVNPISPGETMTLQVFHIIIAGTQVAANQFIGSVVNKAWRHNGKAKANTTGRKAKAKAPSHKADDWTYMDDSTRADKSSRKARLALLTVHSCFIVCQSSQYLKSDNCCTWDKKAVLSQRWPRDARYISRSWGVAEIWPFEIIPSWIYSNRK